MNTLSATDSNVASDSWTSKDRDVDHNRVAIARVPGCDLGLAIDKKFQPQKIAYSLGSHEWIW